MDLALVLAKREITRNWKSSAGPKATLWRGELIRWADCEGTIMMREAKMGRGNVEMARAWETLLDELKAPNDPGDEEPERGNETPPLGNPEQ